MDNESSERIMWSKILTGVVLAGIIGGFGLAFAQQETNGILQTTQALHFDGQQKINEAYADKFGSLDNNVNTIRKDISTIKQDQAKFQGEMSANMAILLQRKKENK